MHKNKLVTKSNLPLLSKLVETGSTSTSSKNRRSIFGQQQIILNKPNTTTKSKVKLLKKTENEVGRSLPRFSLHQERRAIKSRPDAIRKPSMSLQKSPPEFASRIKSISS